ncbi:phthiocerol/phthiodiolone dimycocerosyl transferase family protein [Pilimelia columellifera]|uniref:Phthiocerol/phthiodiolone dimycocerosyl transferase n=1 Tax=Pilimelia columellifera subsp. columellifera TaxID=706583 RepID=A0ABN3NPG7_9ACTN
MRRELSRSELMYTGEIRAQILIICTVRGGVDPVLLDRALSAALAGQPSLRSRLTRDGERWFLTLLEPEKLPRLTVRPNGPDAQVREYNTPLPVGGPLVRAVLLAGADEDTLVLGVDHAICDGRSANELCYRLWRIYAEIETGTYEPPVAPRESWPAPIDDLLPPRAEEELEAHVRIRLERAAGAPVALLPFLAVREDAEPPEGMMTSCRLLLTRVETNRVLAGAKDAGVPLNGYVAAALLAALRDQLPPEYDDHRLGCFNAVDLRDRVATPFGREEMVPTAAWHQTLAEVPRGADLVSLGNQLNADLREAVERGGPALELQAIDRLLAHPTVWALSLMLSNVGRIDGPASPPGLKIVDMRQFAVNSKWNPERGRGPVLAEPMTVRGRLSIEMPYSTQCFTSAQMTAIHDHVRKALGRLADRVPALG